MKLHRLLGVIVEPQERCNFLHEGCSLFWDNLVDSESGQPVFRHVLHFRSFSRLSRTRNAVILRIRGKGRGFSSGTWIDPFASGNFSRSLAKAFTAEGVGIEADVMLEGGEGYQNSAIGRRRHPPLQALHSTGRRCANTGAQLAQFLPRTLGSGIDVLRNALGRGFLGSHAPDFIGFGFAATHSSGLQSMPPDQ